MRLRVSILGFHALMLLVRTRLNHFYGSHSIAMKEKFSQKTAIIVGMLVEPPGLSLIHFEADEAFCQAPALVE